MRCFCFACVYFRAVQAVDFQISPTSNLVLAVGKCQYEFLLLPPLCLGRASVVMSRSIQESSVVASLMTDRSVQVE